MQKTKTLFLFLVIVIFSSFIAPFTVAYADSPPPPNYFYSYVTNADSNVKYTDILIKISKSSKRYTDLNTSNANSYGFNSSTPIVAYNKDGYMSISFHCKNVYSEKSNQQDDSDMSKLIELNNGYKPINTITDSIKIALLDKKGNILMISDAVSVIPTSNATFPRTVNYDAQGTTPTVDFAHHYHTIYTDILLIFSVFAFLIRMAISIIIETLIAIPFIIRPLWKIIVVNVVTQILLFELIASGRLGYTNAVIIGEIFVFVSEFVAYIFLFKHISKPKLALYTVIANTASLAVGLIFNAFHVLMG